MDRSSTRQAIQRMWSGVQDRSADDGPFPCPALCALAAQDRTDLHACTTAASILNECERSLGRTAAIVLLREHLTVLAALIEELHGAPQRSAVPPNAGAEPARTALPSVDPLSKYLPKVPNTGAALAQTDTVVEENFSLTELRAVYDRIAAASRETALAARSPDRAALDDSHAGAGTN